MLFQVFYYGLKFNNFGFTFSLIYNKLLQNSLVLNWQVRKHKDQKRQEIWYRKICHKIAEEPQFPKDEIIEMYLCNDNGYVSGMVL